MRFSSIVLSSCSFNSFSLKTVFYAIKMDGATCIYLHRYLQKKASTITDDNTYALAQYFTHLHLGRRYRVPKVRTNRLKKRFVDLPVAIAILNSEICSNTGGVCVWVMYDKQIRCQNFKNYFIFPSYFFYESVFYYGTLYP